MTKTYNDALEWAAKWIEDTLRAGPETDERTIEFGTNMAMTLRAARVQPVDDARVREIAEQVVGTVFDNTAASHETLRAVMIERIADYLLPQLSSDESRCGLCGHVGGIGDASGLCVAQVPVCSDDYHGTRPCGCACVFPVIGADHGEQREGEK